jgi:hypothetical protein
MSKNKDELIFVLMAVVEFYANEYNWDGGYIKKDVSKVQGNFATHYVGGELARRILSETALTGPVEDDEDASEDIEVEGWEWPDFDEEE